MSVDSTLPSPPAGEGARLNEPLGANLVAAGEGVLSGAHPAPSAASAAPPSPAQILQEGGEGKAVFATYALSLIVFILDQLSKSAILRHFKAFTECGPDSPFASQSCDQSFLPFINFTMVWNHGVSMSMIQGGGGITRWIITILTTIVALVVAWWISRERDKWQLAAYGLILGGALGNILDRVRYGAVVDFIRAHAYIMGAERSFWVFNVADAAITAGVILLLLRSVAGSGKQDMNSPSGKLPNE